MHSLSSNKKKHIMILRSIEENIRKALAGKLWRTICAYQLQGLAQGRSRPHLEVRRLHGETPRGRGYGEVQAVGIHKHG